MTRAVEVCSAGAIKALYRVECDERWRIGRGACSSSSSFVAYVLQLFQAVLENTPSNIAKEEVWLQLGHAYELQKQSERAKEAYEKALAVNPSHAKVLQQLGA